MNITNALIRLRDDLKDWTLNNLNSLRSSIPSTDGLATEDFVNDVKEEVNSLTLGLHTDGLIYIFKNGEPIGNGIKIDGTIDNETTEPEASTNLLETGEIYLNQRYSSSGGGLVSDDASVGMFAIIVPFESDISATYTLEFDNLKVALKASTNQTMFLLDENKGNPVNVNGGNNFSIMTEGVDNGELREDGTRAGAVTFTSPSTDRKYIAISLLVKVGELTMDDIKDYTITLKSDKENTSTGIVYPEGSELSIGQRFSQSGGGLVTDEESETMFALIIPVESNTNYLLTIKNLTLPATSAGSTLYLLNSDKTAINMINGSNNIATMTSGVTTIDNNTGVEVEISTYASTAYVALSIATGETTTEQSIANHIITLENLGEVQLDPTTDPADLTDQVSWTADTRLSSSDGSYKEATGIYASSDIQVGYGDVIRIYGATAWSSYSYLASFISSGTLLGVVTDMSSGGSNYVGTTLDSNQTLTITIKDKSVAYIRLSGNGITPENMRVSINMELAEEEPDTLPEGVVNLMDTSEIYLNKRYSQSGGGLVDATGMLALYIPVTLSSDTTHTLKFRNLSVPIPNSTNATLYGLDANKAFYKIMCSSNSLPDLPADELTVLDNGTGAEIKFAGSSAVKYLALSILIKSATTITETDIENHIITLDE